MNKIKVFLNNNNNIDIKNLLNNDNYDITIGSYNELNKDNNYDIYQFFSIVDNISDKYIYFLDNIDNNIKDQINMINNSILSITTNKDILNNFDSKKLFYIDDISKILNIYDILLNNNINYYNSDVVRKKIINTYETTEIILSNKRTDKLYQISIDNGIKLINKNIDDISYKVTFVDHKYNDIVFETIIKNGFWASPNRKWFTLWDIYILNMNDNKKILYKMDLTNKSVFIELKSKTIDETNKWLKEVDKFRIHYKCNVYCKTPHNENIDITEFLNINIVDKKYSTYASYIIEHSDDLNINPKGETDNNAKYFFNLE